jgi:hypothetical protein
MKLLNRNKQWLWKGTAAAVPRLGERSMERLAGAKEAAEKLRVSGEIDEKHPSGAKARVDSAVLTARLKSCPFKAGRFSAACKALIV